MRIIGLSICLFLTMTGVSSGQGNLNPIKESTAYLDRLQVPGTGDLFVDLLRFEEVLLELKIDESQRAVLKESFREIREARDEYRKFGTPIRNPKLDSKQKDVLTRLGKSVTTLQSNIEDILDPLQIDRLVGIFCQQQGGKALLNPIVAKRVKLDSTQKEKMVTIVKTSTIGKVDAFSKEAMKDVELKVKALDSSILEILTEEQRHSFSALTGEKFELIRASKDASPSK